MLFRRKFFDFVSFTPICKEAERELNKIIKFQSQYRIANPFSSHKEGREAKNLVEKAKIIISSILSVKKDDIIFTSGATEANRLILNSVFTMYRHSKTDKDKKFHIILSNMEHQSMYRYANLLCEFGAEISIVDVDEKGFLNKKDLQKALREDTKIVSVLTVNNETGAIQNIRELVGMVREYEKKVNKKIIFHTDAAQAGAYIPINFAQVVDAITIDSTKIFGPQGVGCLYINRKKGFLSECGRVDYMSLRPGTPSVPLIFAFAIAYKKAVDNQTKNIKKLNLLKTFFINESSRVFQKACIYGINKPLSQIKEKHLSKFTPHIVRLQINDISDEYLAALLDERGFAVSTKAACSNNEYDGFHKELSGIRISFAPFQTKRDVKKLIQNIAEVWPLARESSVQG